MKGEERYLPCLSPFARSIWGVDDAVEVQLNRDETDGSQPNPLDSVGPAGVFVDITFLASELEVSRWDPCKLFITERRFNDA